MRKQTMREKMNSRKFLIVQEVLVLATLLVIFKIITGEIWLGAVVCVVGAYFGANVWQKKSTVAPTYFEEEESTSEKL